MRLEKELFSKYFEDCFCYENEEVVKLAILSKRGFYVDLTDSGEIVLNEFSTSKDRTDFAKYMGMDSKTIIDELFKRDSIYNQEVCYPNINKKWIKSFGSSRMYGEKIPTLALEPFVAKFVHSLALCGIYTYWSCDGWHLEKEKSKEVRICFSDRYSNLWIDTILRNDKDLNAIGADYICGQEGGYIAFPFRSGSDRIEQYIKLSKIADIIYQKRRYYMDCKSYLRKELLHKKKTTVPNEVLSVEFDRIFLEYSEKKSFEMGENPMKNISTSEIDGLLKKLKNKRKLSESKKLRL